MSALLESPKTNDNLRRIRDDNHMIFTCKPRKKSYKRLLESMKPMRSGKRSTLCLSLTLVAICFCNDLARAEDGGLDLSSIASLATNIASSNPNLIGNLMSHLGGNSAGVKQLGSLFSAGQASGQPDGAATSSMGQESASALSEQWSDGGGQSSASNGKPGGLRATSSTNIEPLKRGQASASQKRPVAHPTVAAGTPNAASAPAKTHPYVMVPPSGGAQQPKQQAPTSAISKQQTSDNSAAVATLPGSTPSNQSAAATTSGVVQQPAQMQKAAQSKGQANNKQGQQAASRQANGNGGGGANLLLQGPLAALHSILSQHGIHLNGKASQNVIMQVVSAYLNGKIPAELMHIGLSGRVPPQLIGLALSGQVPPQLIQMIITGQIPTSTINAFLDTINGIKNTNSQPAAQANGSSSSSGNGDSAAATSSGQDGGPSASGGGSGQIGPAAADQAKSQSEDANLATVTVHEKTDQSLGLLSSSRAIFEALLGLKPGAFSQTPVLNLPVSPLIPRKGVRRLTQRVGDGIHNMAQLIPF